MRKGASQAHLFLAAVILASTQTHYKHVASLPNYWFNLSTHKQSFSQYLLTYNYYYYLLLLCIFMLLQTWQYTRQCITIPLIPTTLSLPTQHTNQLSALNTDESHINCPDPNKVLNLSFRLMSLFFLFQCKFPLVFFFTLRCLKWLFRTGALRLKLCSFKGVMYFLSNH